MEYGILSTIDRGFFLIKTLTLCCSAPAPMLQPAAVAHSTVFIFKNRVYLINNCISILAPL